VYLRPAEGARDALAVLAHRGFSKEEYNFKKIQK